MKQFILTIFLSVAFSAILNAAQRKIAYDRGGKISLPTSMVPIQRKLWTAPAGDFASRHTRRV